MTPLCRLWSSRATSLWVGSASPRRLRGSAQKDSRGEGPRPARPGCARPAREPTNVTSDQKAAGWDDVWTWTAMDADTKLCVSYMVGVGGADWAAMPRRSTMTVLRTHVSKTRDVAHPAFF